MRSLVLDPSIQLALLEAQVVSTCIALRKGLIDELVARIDNLMALYGVDAVGLPKQVSIARLLDQDKQSVLIDGPHLSWTAKEWAFLDGLDQGPNGHCVVEFVCHDGRLLTEST